MFSDMTVLDSGSVGSTGDYEYIRVRCHYMLMGISVTLTAMYLFHNDIVYNICFAWMTSDEERLNKLDQIMDTVLASVVFS